MTTDEAQMIDIESMDRDALIAEIRRLRGESKWHRKCPKCTGTAILDGAVGEHWYWAKCQRCGLLGLMRRTGAEAWAAWDGVEGNKS